MILNKALSKDNINFSSLTMMVLLYVSDDTLLFGTNENSTFIFAKYLIVAFCGGVMLYKIKRLNSSDLILLGILFLFFFITSVLNGFRYGFLYNMLLLFVSLLFSRICALEDFKKYFCAFTYILAIISLIAYFLYQINPSLFGVFPVYRIEGGEEFICLYMADIYKPLSFRNFGIFREPGVYMIYLNLALFIEWFSKTPSLKKVFVYLLCLLTTISTAGLLIGLLIITFGIVAKKKSKLVFVVLPIIAIAWYFVNNSELPLDVLLFSKLEEGNSNAIVRWASITVPLNMFISNPLGVGPEGYNELCPILSNQMYHVAIDPRETTNTFLKILAVYGIIVFYIYMKGFWRFIKMIANPLLLRFLLLFVLILALSNEDMRTSFLFSLMIAYGFSNYRSNKTSLVKKTDQL